MTRRTKHGDSSIVSRRISQEVDLTVGRAENVLDNIGAIAGPFAIGPVDEATDIQTEQQLIDTFGKPISTDAQYEYWMSASNFLSYGGVLKVVRTDDTQLNNANAGVGIASTTSLKSITTTTISRTIRKATTLSLMLLRTLEPGVTT